jgi:hypothetical protein
MTVHYLMFRAYGDCVISYGLLESLPAGATVRILGTGVAQRVARVLGATRHPVTTMLDDIAAFYDVRQSGPRRAMDDLRRVRRALAPMLAPGDSVLFEHADFRNWLLLPRMRGITVLEPQHGASIYQDRHRMLSAAFGPMPEPRPSPRPRRPVRSLVLNPAARLEQKRLPQGVVENVVSHASARGIEVILLDPEARHARLAARVREYVPQARFEADIAALRGADFYVGADSFFLHLAYQFGLPMLQIAPVRSQYFAPPGLVGMGGALTLREAQDPAIVGAALDALWVPAAGDPFST